MRRFVEILHRAQAAAIAVVVEDAFVASLMVRRSEDENLGCEFDQAFSVHRRLVDINNISLRRCLRIDRISHPAA